MHIEIIGGLVVAAFAILTFGYFLGRDDGINNIKCLYIAEQQSRVMAEKSVAILRAKNQILEEEILKQQRQIAQLRQGVEIA